MKGNYLIASSLFLYVPSQGNNTSNANNIPFNYLFTQQIFIRFWLRASTALGTLLFAVWSKWKIHQTRAFKTQWREKLHFGMAVRTLTPFRKPQASAEFILQPSASSTAEGNQSIQLPRTSPLPHRQCHFRPVCCSPGLSCRSEHMLREPTIDPQFG